MKFEVKLNFDDKKFIKAFENYGGVVKFGIPRETASNGKIGFNNADILAVMENGSKVNKIPKRELLKPVIEKHLSKIQEMLGEIYICLLEEKINEADELMKRLAFRMETWTKQYFVDPSNNWEPNSPITINGGWMRNKVTGKPFYVKGKRSSKPLIDTGELRKAIRGVVFKD